MDQNPKVPQDPTLDLDQGLGEARPIKVKYQDKEYRLTRPENLTPRGAAALWRTKREMEEFRRSGVLNAAGKVDESKLTAKWEQKIMEFVSKSIGLVCPELVALDLPLPKLMMIFEFYNQEVSRDQKNSPQAEEAQPSKIPSPA